MKSKTGKPAGAYLNVDLEVRSRSDLAVLVRALSPALFNLHSGRVGGAHFASFEAPDCGVPPDEAIRAMAKAVQALPRRARAVWNRADDRVFDIGVEQARSAWPFALALERDTLVAMVEIGARVAVTLYGLPSRRPKPPSRALQRTALTRRR